MPCESAHLLSFISISRWALGAFEPCKTLLELGSESCVENYFGARYCLSMLLYLKVENYFGARYCSSMLLYFKVETRLASYYIRVVF